MYRLEFYNSTEKLLKIKIPKVWGLVSTFVEVTGEKYYRGYPS